MTEEQIDLLIKYINAKIACLAAESSYDNWAFELLQAYEIEQEQELRAALKEKE